MDDEYKPEAPKTGVFKVSDLRKVADAYPWDAPPGVGARVRLSSGGPACLIVDADGDQRTMELPNGTPWSVDYRCLMPA